MKAESKARRGRLKGQAPASAYEEAGGPEERAQLATFGADFASSPEAFRDCLLALDHCPDSEPDLSSIADAKQREVLRLGWRFVRALKRFKSEDRVFIERRFAVRAGEAMQARVMGRPIRPADPRRAALARFAAKQWQAAWPILAGKRATVSKHLTARTVAQMGAWLGEQGIDPGDDKSLAQACRDAGVIMAERGQASKKRKRT